MQEFIELGWHTVPLRGQLIRHEDGTKTIPDFDKDWRQKYTDNKNTRVTKIGGVITGKVSNIVAIDCDNEATYDLFRALDIDYDFVFISKGKGYRAGTIIYEYSEDLPPGFMTHNDSLSLDFYSDEGFVYLPTIQNKTKVPLTAPLPRINAMPPAVKMLLEQLYLATKVKPQTNEPTRTNIMTAHCINPLVTKFVNNKEFLPGLFRIITPKDFRSLDEYQANGYLHPADVPDGRGSEYLSKVSAILGSDISIDDELYVQAMQQINKLFDNPMQQSRLESTILDPMVEKKSSINGKPIWQYDENWSDYRLVLTSKRQTVLEAGFDDNRNLYYLIDELHQKYYSFIRDSEMMSYVEASVVNPPKKIDMKKSLPIINVISDPHKEFGFHEGDDPTARTFNTFVPSEEILIINNPERHKQHYSKPKAIISYLESLIPNDMIRKYVLRFLRTKLTTFKYSPVILYFMGKPGSGKDTFVSILEQIMTSVARPSVEEFLEVFNDWMLDNYFVQLDEYGNQLTTIKEREKALGKLKSYTGKSKIQVRAMRVTGKTFYHNVTFVMTANKNPLMLEEEDRRICFISTPNVLKKQKWVQEMGGVAAVHNNIMNEIKDFCYWLATEFTNLGDSDYVSPPEAEDKNKLIADSMHAAQRIAFAIKNSMSTYLVNLAEEYGCDELTIEELRMNNYNSEVLDELYSEMTNYEGNTRSLMKALRSAGLKVTPTTRNGNKAYNIHMEKHIDE